MSARLARLIAAGAIIAALGLAGTSQPAGAAGSPGDYLDLGASVSLGVQPSPDTGHGAPTTAGYANDLVAEQAALGNDLHLVQMGCPGETTSSFGTGDDRCYRAPDNQLAEAVGFLRAHPDDRTLVTVDVGFDIVGCLWHRVVDAACLDARLDAVPGQLAHVLGALRDAAGPHVLFLGVGAYDPFLADGATQDPAEQAFAEASLDAIGRLNGQLRAGYDSAGIPMVEIASLFSGDDRDTDAVESSSLAAMAEHTCQLTWMCTAEPNIHPNDAGYQAIAGAIEARLPRDW